MCDIIPILRVNHLVLLVHYYLAKLTQDALVIR